MAQSMSASSRCKDTTEECPNRPGSRGRWTEGAVPTLHPGTAGAREVPSMRRGRALERHQLAPPGEETGAVGPHNRRGGPLGTAGRRRRVDEDVRVWEKHQVIDLRLRREPADSKESQGRAKHCKRAKALPEGTLDAEGRDGSIQ